MGDNTSRSLLNSVTEEGQDDAGGTITLPASTFSYQASTPGWTATSTSWNAPVALLNYQLSPSADAGVRVADVNGDGLPDVIQSYTNGGGVVTQNAYVNTGNRWVASSTWNPPVSFVNYQQTPDGDYGVRIADVNGDGLPDVMQSYESGSGATTENTWLNNGNGWTLASSTWDEPVPFVNYHLSTSPDAGVRIADINGDGLPDILQSWQNSAGTVTATTYLNTGTGWTLASTSWNSPLPFVSFQTSTDGDAGVRMADINGDGLTDIMQSFENSAGTVTASTYLNTGTGWVLAPTAWNDPLPFVNYHLSSQPDAGVRVIDVNGDGLPDITQSWENGAGGVTASTYLNTGNGWALASASWNTPVSFVNFQANANGDYGVRTDDVNGDNETDLS